jgi:hypothetical protein
MRNRILDGSIYDNLKHPFYEERERDGTYIPLRERRPSARMNLCRSVVEDSASLLFSEAHFPTVQHAETTTREQLAKLVKELNLNEMFLDACYKGSVGSVALFLRVLGNRPFVDPRSTTYLTPVWQDLAPDTLASVTEQYKVKGAALTAAGWPGEYDDYADYWMRTVWDANAETTYLPVEVKRVDDEPITWTPDPARTAKHNLGFVPIVWITNLPGGDTVDGLPTFKEDAIDVQIEMDYLLSQNGRSLKYSMDPTLVIKEPAFGQGQEKDTQGRPAPVGGAGKALVVDTEGDAKLLEANGSSSEAVVAYLRHLRELALESLKGNRASAEKLATAQSGKALELLNQTLVWLADRLRISYGEKALRELIQMLIAVSAKFSLKFKDGEEVGVLAKGPVTLVWPAWYAPTPSESQQRMETLARGVDAGIISRETAVRTIAAEYDIEDLAAEMKLIEAWLAVRDANAEKQVKVSA